MDAAYCEMIEDKDIEILTREAAVVRDAIEHIDCVTCGPKGCGRNADDTLEALRRSVVALRKARR